VVSIFRGDIVERWLDSIRGSRGVVLLLGAALIATSLLAVAQRERTWKSLAEDDLHDPDLPAIELLQQPKEALSLLPADAVGNKVQWVEALSDHYISPRTNLYPSTEIRVLDMDIILERTGEMPMVRFPHKAHTEWLDCNNCHDRIFKAEVGANEINMMQILMGNQCGQCHGAVSFPLTECNRCHSVSRRTFTGEVGAQPTVFDSGVPDATD